MPIEKLLTLAIFVICYALAVSRRFKLSYISIASACLLLILGAIPWDVAVFKSIKWDVLGIYWGFMMVSFVFAQSGVPSYLAQGILRRVKQERFALVSLCLLTAFLSAFMENVGVVLMMAPVAVEIARRMGSSLFTYMVCIAVSSNVVTTVSMVADPPSIILAMETGMKFKDFYWFQGKPGLGTLTILGVVAAMLTLLFQFRGMDKRVEIGEERVPITTGATVLFVGGVIALATGPYFGVRVGVVGLVVGLISLWMGRAKIKEMIVEFDWDSFFFIVGIFVVIGSLQEVNLLKDFASFIDGLGIASPGVMLALMTWIAVAASSFMDNVPYTVLMIPVCTQLASLMGISAFPLLFGMLVGTGSGGNITPVGAAANVFACGILEKNGYKVRLWDYLKISVPFTVAAVATIHLLLWLFWIE